MQSEAKRALVIELFRANSEEFIQTLRNVKEKIYWAISTLNDFGMSGMNLDDSLVKVNDGRDDSTRAETDGVRR